MSRIYTAGSAVDTNSAVAADIAQSQTRDAILLHSGWTLQEEFNSTTGGYHHVVLRCNSATSGLPADFFVALSRKISDGYLFSAMGELYAGRILSHVRMYGTTSSMPIDTATGLRTTPSTLNLDTGLTGANYATAASLPPAANLPWFVAVDNDHVCFRIGNLSEYLGAFTSLVKAPITDPMPLASCFLNSNRSAPYSYSSVSRMPGLTASPAPAYSYSLNDGIPAISDIYLGALGNPVDMSFDRPDLLQGGKSGAFEVPVLHYAPNSVATGYLRGKFKKLLVIYKPPVGTVISDTFTIDGKTHVVMYTDANYALCLDTTAVA